MGITRHESEDITSKAKSKILYSIGFKTVIASPGPVLEKPKKV